MALTQEQLQQKKGLPGSQTCRSWPVAEGKAGTKAGRRRTLPGGMGRGAEGSGDPI